MTLLDFAQLGGAIGGIGVISSFVYVAIQIRNNTRAVRAAAYQQMVSSIAGQLDELARNAELCSLVLRGGDNFESLDRVEKARFRFQTLSFMQRADNAFTQHQIGTLKEKDWLGLRETLVAILSSPGRRVAWGLVKNRVSADFRDYVDGLAAAAAAAAPAVPEPSSGKRGGKTNQRHRR